MVGLVLCLLSALAAQDPTKGPRWQVVASGDHSHETAVDEASGVTVWDEQRYERMRELLARNPAGARPDLPAWEEGSVYLFLFRGVVRGPGPHMTVTGVRLAANKDVLVDVRVTKDDKAGQVARSPWVVVRFRAEDLPPRPTFRMTTSRGQ